MAKLDLADLNILKEIYRTHSITAAMDQIGLSQPSISVRLSHLRRHFGDPLFVRTSQGMKPTPRMESLLPAIRQSIELLGTGGGGLDEFEPAASTRKFRISMTDVGYIVLFPHLMNLFERHAPGLRIEGINLDKQTAHLLEDGEADIAIGFAAELHGAFYQQRLATAYYACIARKGHPRIGTKLTKRAIVEEAHVAVDAPGTGYWKLDKALEKQGIQRSVKVCVPSYLGLAQIIASTDMLAIVPARLGQTLSAAGNIKTLAIPVPTPSYEVKQYWHERYHRDPANRWLRQVILDAFNSMPQAAT
ncbi:MAG: LysR family transcriptional regulator [Pseudomonadota bacterium]